MLDVFLFALLLTQGPQQPSSPQTNIQQIATSGLCADLPDPPDKRVAPPPAIAPGPPPILSFRLYEGKRHGHFNNSDLMLDDAGH
jgi:hypothetical protein